MGDFETSKSRAGQKESEPGSPSSNLPSHIEGCRNSAVSRYLQSQDIRSSLTLQQPDIGSDQT